MQVLFLAAKKGELFLLLTITDGLNFERFLFSQLLSS